MRLNTKRADLLEKKLLIQILAQFSDARNVIGSWLWNWPFYAKRWMESTLALESIGSDTSKAMLKEAKERWPNGALLQSDGCHLPLKEKSC